MLFLATGPVLYVTNDREVCDPLTIKTELLWALNVGIHIILH